MKNENWGTKNKQKQSDICITIIASDDLIILYDQSSINLVCDESVQIIDSSVILHVTPNKEFFISYTSSNFRILKMDNDGVSKLISISDVLLAI